jgi:hypothetical protein
VGVPPVHSRALPEAETQVRSYIRSVRHPGWRTCVGNVSTCRSLLGEFLVGKVYECPIILRSVSPLRHEDAPNAGKIGLDRSTFRRVFS